LCFFFLILFEKWKLYRNAWKALEKFILWWLLSKSMPKYSFSKGTEGSRNNANHMASNSAICSDFIRPCDNFELNIQFLVKTLYSVRKLVQPKLQHACNKSTNCRTFGIWDLGCNQRVCDVYFVTGLKYILQQPSTAGLAKTKADIAKKSSYSYSSRWLWLVVQEIYNKF
jgi:hypothetical protein